MDNKNQQILGKMVGKYRVDNFISEGGAAQVYEVFHVDLEAKYVLKLFRFDLDDENCNRFIIESKITANLNHSNIVSCYSNGIYENHPYMILEYVDGESLLDLINKKKQIHPLLSLSLLHILCNALDYAHNCSYTLYGEKQNGIIHRDIKPENILMSNQGIVKLSDFGLAKIKVDPAIHQTQEHTMIGTSWYMSPEQMRYEYIDCRSDIYSLGCVFFEMLTGEPAFPFNNTVDLIQKKNEDDYSKSCLKDFSNGIVSILNKMIVCDIRKRYQSTNGIIKDVNKILNENGITNPENYFQSYIIEKKGFITLKIKEPYKRKTVLTYSLFIFSSLLIVLSFYKIGPSLFKNIWQKDISINKYSSSDTVENNNIQKVKKEINPPEVIEQVPKIKTKRIKKNNPNKNKISLRKKNIISRKNHERKVDRDLFINNKNREEEESNKKIAELNQIDFVTLLNQRKYLKCIEATKINYNENDTAFLCYLGSLIETGQYNKVNDLIFSNDINDAYLYYLRGKYSLKKKNYDHAELMFLEALKFNSFIKINERINFYFVVNSIEKYISSPNNSNNIFAKKNIEDYVSTYCGKDKNKYCETFRYFLSNFYYEDIKDKYSSVEF